MIIDNVQISNNSSNGNSRDSRNIGNHSIHTKTSDNSDSSNICIFNFLAALNPKLRKPTFEALGLAARNCRVSLLGSVQVVELL